MKISLDNRTYWRSDHIREFISKQLPEERPDLCKRGAPALRVVVVYTRTRPYMKDKPSGSSGCALVKSNWMKIRLSKHIPDKVDLAHVIAHELAHTRGMKDEYVMRHSAKYGRVGSWRSIYAWAEELPLERQVKVSKRTAPDKKLLHAQKMLKSACTREKRAITLRKKWALKVKYYQKKTGDSNVETGI